MEILEDKAIIINEILVLSDLHLGVTYDDRPYPQMEHKDIERRIKKIVKEYEPSQIIFNGDVFSTGKVDKYWKDMFQRFNNTVQGMIFIRGNHEEKRGGYPEFIRRKYRTVDYYESGEYLIYHGHKSISTKNGDIHIIGHLHPTEQDNDVLLKKELVSNKIELFVLPKFSNIVGGVEVDALNSNSRSISIDKFDCQSNFEIIKRYNL
jgi:putative SbcD/Mre11-related phosphoesterase